MPAGRHMFVLPMSCRAVVQPVTEDRTLASRNMAILPAEVIDLAWHFSLVVPALADLLPLVSLYVCVSLQTVSSSVTYVWFSYPIDQSLVHSP